MTGRKYDLSFWIRKSVAYHDNRRSYYQNLDSLVKILGLVIASAVFTENFGNQAWAKWLAGFFVVVSSASIVQRFGAMGNLHESLYKDFVDLQKKLVPISPSSQPELDALEEEILAVELREPPIYPALNRYCHNQICRVDREHDALQPLNWYHYPLKNFFPFHKLPDKQSA